MHKVKQIRNGNKRTNKKKTIGKWQKANNITGRMHQKVDKSGLSNKEMKAPTVLKKSRQWCKDNHSSDGLNQWFPNLFEPLPKSR